MLRHLVYFSGIMALILGIYAVPAMAGQPVLGAMGLQTPASSSAERIYEFHNMLLWIITAITLFVLALLVYVVVRFNKKANPVPSKTTHNLPLEIVWTVIPVVILIIIAVPSFKLLYYTDRVENPDMTIKVTGYQWYWGYEYPDHGGINFMSYMIPDSEIDPAQGQVRLLSTDAPVVLPVGKNIQVNITAADVLHSWAVPALGVKMDSVPGRLNSTWFRINRPGVYFGQCSELCGKDHAYMPIEIHAVSEEEFHEWVIAQGGELPPVVEVEEEVEAVSDTAGADTDADEGEALENEEQENSEGEN